MPVTNYNTGFRIAGPAYQAQLYAGPAGIFNARLLTTNGISGTSAGFMTGAASGYFLGGTRTIEGYAAGTTVTLQVRVWATASGPSFETAGERGESNLFQLMLGDASSVPNMVGLRAIIMVPEPSTKAVAFIGVLAIMVPRMCRQKRV